MISGLGATDPDDIMEMRPDPALATRSRLGVLAEMPEVFAGVGGLGILAILGIWALWPRSPRRRRRRSRRRRRTR